jgi:hypothetical protein
MHERHRVVWSVLRTPAICRSTFLKTCLQEKTQKGHAGQVQIEARTLNRLRSFLYGMFEDLAT